MARGDGEVEFNDAEIQRILNSAPMRAEVQRACNLIMARARVISPVRSGTYINHFRVELKPWKQLRIVGFVINDDPKSGAIEAIHGVLTKARRARG